MSAHPKTRKERRNRHFAHKGTDCTQALGRWSEFTGRPAPSTRLEFDDEPVTKAAPSIPSGFGSIHNGCFLMA